MLPPAEARPPGGRPRIDDRRVLTGFVVMLETGANRYVVARRSGTPPSVTISGASVHDSKMLVETVDAIRPIKKPIGRPWRRRSRLHGDKGYGLEICRKGLRQRGIIPRMEVGVKGPVREGERRREAWS